MRFIQIIVVALCLGALSSAQAADSIIKRLENGEVISAKAGSAFTAQAVIPVDLNEIDSKVFKDLKALPKYFSRISMAVPYTSNGRKFLYFKIRGMDEADGFLMEVMEDTSETFVDAQSYLNTDTFRAQSDPSSDALLTTPDAVAGSLSSEVMEANSDGDIVRQVGSFLRDRSRRVVLVGPVNEPMSMLGSRMTISLGATEYSVRTKDGVRSPLSKVAKLFEKSENWMESYTYFVVKVAYSAQAPRTEIGDYRGLNDAQVAFAEKFGSHILQNFSSTSIQ